MKKITVLAVAAALAMPAFAAAPQSKAMTSADAELSSVAPMSLNDVVKAQRVKANASVNTVADLLGPHVATYVWGLTNQDPYGGTLSPNFAGGDNANEILIKNFPFSDVDLVATVDMSAKTITLEKQDLFFNPNYSEMVVMQPERWNDTGDGTIAMDKIVGNIQADGTITFDQRDAITFRVTQGYFFFVYNLVMEPIEFFQFNASEWKQVGQAEFTDNLMNNFFKDEYKVTTPQKVDCYINANNSNVYLIANPYAGTAWAQLNPAGEYGKSNIGYFYLDVTYPECVLLRPFVGTGFWIDFAQEGEDANIQQVYAYNDEGQRVYVDGWEIEDVIADYAAIGEPMSSYDESTHVAEIINLWFAPGDQPLGHYYFGEENPTSLTFNLPTLDGVNDVVFDADAPVKYFNLQGVEVANPAKGDLVIKTQGNKAQKVIIK